MIIPAILEKSFEEIVNKIKISEKFATLVQIDFVDGKLTEGATFLEAEKLNTIDTPLSFDLHFMVSNPLYFLKTKINKATKVCAQIEAFDTEEKADLFIEKARGLGYRVGLSLNPETDLSAIETHLNKLDFVQFMTIHPGSQGQELLPEVLKKIQKFKALRPDTKVQVDGGIKDENILKVAHAGVTDFVVGSELFRDKDPQEMFLKLNKIAALAHTNSVATIRREKIQKIAVLGGAAWHEEDPPYKDAYETSKLLAEAGFEIVNGGGPGVMCASTKGAHAGGGKVLAITYHPNKPKRHYEGVDPNNDFDDEVITLDYFDRTKVMLQTTQLHIVFKGSIGTLSEFGMTWISSWIHEPDNKPVILVGDFWQDFLDVIHKHILLVKNEEKLLKVCQTPQEVLDYIKGLD